MSDEHDSWFKDAFGVDLGQSLNKIKDEASAVIDDARNKVAQVVQGVQGAVEGAVDGVTSAAAGVVKKVAGAVAPSGSSSAGPAGAAGGGTGSFPLGGSVGRGGKNAPNDVRAVQAALGISADGQCGGGTIAAIEAFQRTLGLAKPDGRVDAGGGTERALAGGASGASAAAQAPVPAKDDDDSESLFDRAVQGVKDLGGKIVEEVEEDFDAVKAFGGRVIKGAEDLADDAKKLGGNLIPDDPSAFLSSIGASGSGGSLDSRFQASLALSRKSGDFKTSAELLNGFNVEDINKRLIKLSPSDIEGLHKGALENPRVGPNSNVAQLTGTPDDIKGNKNNTLAITTAANLVALRATVNATAFGVQILSAADAFRTHAKSKIKPLSGKITAGDLAQSLSGVLIGKIGSELAAKVANEVGKKIIDFTVDKIKEKVGSAVNSKSDDIEALNNAVDEIFNAANAGGVQMQGVVNEKIKAPCNKIIEAMKTPPNSKDE